MEWTYQHRRTYDPLRIPERIEMPRLAPAAPPGGIDTSCQCEHNACNRGGRCRRHMTQEDLLCNRCRDLRDQPHCHLHYDGITADCVFGKFVIGLGKDA